MTKPELSEVLLHDAKTALMYEELRAAIDDGHESMTHADALAEIAAMRAENIELRAKLASIGAGGVQALSAAPAMIREFESVLDEVDQLFASTDCADQSAWHGRVARHVKDALSGARAALAASPTPPAEQQAAPKAAPGEQFDSEGFRAWVRQNLPDDTIIGSSLWWADHLTRWAQLFVKAAPQQEAQEPALFVSAKQLADLADPSHATGGSYLPARKTRAGLFTHPLYKTPQPAPAPLSDDVVKDAAFEAVRKKLCTLPRYSFVLDDDGLVRRVQDRTGNWIEFDEAHALFDPVAVDAALAAQGDAP